MAGEVEARIRAILLFDQSIHHRGVEVWMGGQKVYGVGSGGLEWVYNVQKGPHGPGGVRQLEGDSRSSKHQ